MSNRERRGWIADNGNGTFSNPLFYDEFSDPDLIRVGADFYLTGTTMHAMPGLPILHSRDLVNWSHLCYVFDRLDLGPEFRLEDQREIYGQGIWVPCLRYRHGTFYIFSNVNGQTTQLFRATNPAGPWTRTALNPDGPYEVNLEISADEDFGLAEGARVRRGSYTPPFDIVPPDPARVGRMSLHQGGIVDTPTGEWWGFSMMDFNSLGRLTCLSPITWQDGWPYFGLSGNLKRTPRIWTKPHTGHTVPPSAPYERRDDFAGPTLKPIWQWNHVPDDTRWSLAERPGYLRLHALPATDFWWARNTLTQRAIGPESIATTELDTVGMQPGDIAGLALLNLPYAWIGIRHTAAGLVIEQVDQATGAIAQAPLNASRVWLRAHCNFLTEAATLSYSIDGTTFQPLGAVCRMVYQLKTFQGVRYALFHFSTGGAPGGYADFADFDVEQPHPYGLMRPIPFGQRITLSTVGDGTGLAVRGGAVVAVPSEDPTARSAAARFGVVDRGLGRVALQAEDGFVSVRNAGGPGQVVIRMGEPTDAETFQWSETIYGDLMLLSLATHRHLRLVPGTSTVAADQPGPRSDRTEGSCLHWAVDAAETVR